MADPHRPYGTASRSPRASAAPGLGAHLRAYLRTRTLEHWMLFLGGVVVGAILG